MTTRIKKIVGRWDIALAFALPMAIMLAVFALMQVHPMGDRTLLTLDMDSEYIDYYAQIHRFFRGEGSLLRSWNMGMGLDMLGLVAFYTASPFLLILAAFPLEKITEAVVAMTLLKLGMAGGMMALYTRYAFKIRGIMSVVFAVAYALLSYNIAYSSNLMWLDGVAMLPLVALGTEKILRENKWGLFLGSLIYIFITSYYIAYMIGMFSFLYFTCVYFAEERYSHTFKEYAGKLARFLGSAVVAALCCGALLLPAFLNLKNGQDGMWDVQLTHNLKFSIIGMFSKMVIGSYDSLTNSGSPNIFCTVLMLLLFFVYLFHRGVPLREKLVFSGLTGFMLLSFSYGALDLAWHAFEDPTWYPARYSFVFGFLIIHIGLRCVTRMKDIGKQPILMGGGLLLLLLLETGIQRLEKIRLSQLMITAIVALTYVMLLLMARRSPRVKANLAVLLLLAVCGETYLNTAMIVDGISNQFGYSSHKGFTEYRQRFEPQVRKIQAEDDGLYRMEITPQRSANGGMAMGYGGISHYSTTTDQKLNQLLYQLGYNVGTINEVRFGGSTPMTNSILGIKYVVSANNLGDQYDLLRYDHGTFIYKNPNAFPLAYFARKEALEVSLDSLNAFETQNRLLGALLGEEYGETFTSLEHDSTTMSNLEMVNSNNCYEYSRISAGDDTNLRFHLQNPANQPSFALLRVYNDKYFSSAETLVNDKSTMRYFSYRNNGIIPLGDETDIELLFKLKSGILRHKEPEFYALDVGLMASAAQQAQNAGMQISRYDDRLIEGMVVAPQDGIIATTIPYDNGWRIQVDGKAVRQEPLAGVFLAIPVTQGEHTVQMLFTPEGWREGLAISGLGIILLVAAGLRSRRRKKNS